MKLSENNKLRDLIQRRMAELDLKPAEVIKDAADRGMTITPSAFSKYKLGKKGGLSDESVLWLACRLYIPISVNFGVPVLTGSKLSYALPKYDELKALQTLKQIFGKNG